MSPDRKCHIAAYRKLAGLSQTELSGMLGIDRSYLSRLEAGNHQLSADKALKAAEIFGITVEDLYSDAMIPMRHKSDMQVKKIFSFEHAQNATSPSLSTSLLSSALSSDETRYAIIRLMDRMNERSLNRLRGMAEVLFDDETCNELCANTIEAKGNEK